MIKKYAKVGRITTRVIEECSELIKAICKAKRFGLNNRSPRKTENNRLKILNEIEDVVRLCQQLKKDILKEKEEI